MRRLLIATALLLVAPLVAAQAYKWKDANGTVHYSDSPPPQGTKFNKISTTGTVEPLAAPATAETTEGAPKPAAPQQPMADTPENRAKLCSTLQSNMNTLKGNGPVMMEENGQQRVINADQRKQQQANAQTQYQQYCSGSSGS